MGRLSDVNTEDCCLFSISYQPARPCSFSNTSMKRLKKKLRSMYFEPELKSPVLTICGRIKKKMKIRILHVSYFSSRFVD